MFFTLGIIIGFVLVWIINDKWDWVKDKAYFGRSNMLGFRLFFYRNTWRRYRRWRLCDEVKIR